MIRVRDTNHYKNGQGKKREEERARRQVGAEFSGKAFADLTNKEKDALLKAVAIRLGFLLE